MPEHLKALIVILGVGLVVFALARRPVCAAIGLSEARYRHDRNTWLGVTLIAFLSHNFWVFCIVTALVVARRARDHECPIALYSLILFAVPPIQLPILGFGPIGYLFSVEYYRVLSLALLLPLALRLRKHVGGAGVPLSFLDKLIGVLVLWTFVIQAAKGSGPDAVRAAFYLFTDLVLPYYCVSRSIRKLHDFQQVAASFVIAGTIVAVLAVFESSRSWLLYESLRGPLDAPSALPMYLLRGAGGPLRANVSFGNAIVLGYALMVVLAFYLFLQREVRPAWISRAAGAALFAGLIAALSRGPWVGTAAGALLYAASGPGVGKRLFGLVVFGGLAVLGLMLSPLGDKVVQYLPFIGTVESENVDYRQRLFDTSVEVLMQNPWAGDYDYIKNPLMEQMRQGLGIIDMVNTYLQIALPYGLIGLTIFVGVFFCAVAQLWRVRKRHLSTHSEVERLGRALIAAYVAVLVTIATVSSIGVIPTIYWILAGLAASYARAFGTESHVSEVAPLASIRREAVGRQVSKKDSIGRRRA